MVRKTHGKRQLPSLNVTDAFRDRTSRDGNGHQTPIGSCIVDDDPEIVPSVIDRILDSLNSGKDRARSSHRLVCRDHPRRFGHSRIRSHHYESTRAGLPKSNIEAIVILLEYHHVICLVCPDLVSPHLEWPKRLVGDGIEEIRSIPGPGKPVPGALENIRKVGLAADLPDASCVALRAVGVRRICDIVLVVTYDEIPQPEVLLAFGFLVLVEHQFGRAVRTAKHPQPNGIRLALFGLRGIPVIASPEWHGQIRFLRPIPDLLEYGFLKAKRWLQYLRRVSVLGLDMCDHFCF